MKGNITISKPSGGIRGKCISIRIADTASSTTIVEVSMSLEDFADAVTGMHSKCEIERSPTPEDASRFGRELETATGYCERAGFQGREKQAEIVEADFLLNWKTDGWLLADNGTRSQQNGDQHHYGVRRWKEAK